jgi:hypothetical protein
VYPDSRVIELIGRHFVPVRVHVRDRDTYKQLSERFNSPWTPTTLVLDAAGEERHRLEGFLPIDDFMCQLSLGIAHAAFAAKDYTRAMERYEDVAGTCGAGDAGPEGQYWAGVARYRATNDPAALGETAQRFRERYQDTSWAKKASVWEKPQH